jgi:hypothetical protein
VGDPTSGAAVNVTGERRGSWVKMQTLPGCVGIQSGPLSNELSQQIGYQMSDRKSVEKLVDELFTEIQAPQGYFHLSDGETFASLDEFFERIRKRLEAGRDAVWIMNRFLRKHHERGCDKAAHK